MGLPKQNILASPPPMAAYGLRPRTPAPCLHSSRKRALENTEIVLNGDTPKSEAKVASAGTRKHEARPGKKNMKTVRKGRKPSREFVDRRFDARELERGRRSARRDWARFYLSPRMLPPGYYVPPSGRRTFIPDY